MVVRSAALLERAADASRVVFDKTGTLTEAVPRLVELRVEPGAAGDERALLAEVAGLEQGLAHPLARAVLAAASERGVVAVPATDVRVVPGRGVRGRVGGRELFVGSGTPVEAASAFAAGARPAADDGSLAVVRSGARVLGTLRFAERARPGAAEAVAALARLGVRVSVLSGDRSVGAIVPDVVPARRRRRGARTRGEGRAPACVPCGAAGGG